ncbi:MAG: DUF4339 domain-containing protein [Planctomycetia bacterium]|nr:DUF4339 domain-containing protein [Planctomycetia bacterium]
MSSEEWFYIKNGRTEGPLTGSTLQNLIKKGTLSPNDLISDGATRPFLPARSFPGLFDKNTLPAATLPESVPPPLPPLPTQEIPAADTKNFSGNRKNIPSKKKSPPSDFHRSPQRMRHPIDLLLFFLQKQFNRAMLAFLERMLIYLGHLFVLSGAVIIPIYSYILVRKLGPGGIPSASDSGIWAVSSLSFVLAITLLLLVFQFVTYRLFHEIKFWNTSTPAVLSTSSVCDIISAIFLFFGVATLVSFTLSGLSQDASFIPIIIGLGIFFGCVYLAFYALHPLSSAIQYKSHSTAFQEIHGICIFLVKLFALHGSIMLYGMMSLVIIIIASWEFFSLEPFTPKTITLYHSALKSQQKYAFYLLIAAMAPAVGHIILQISVYFLQTFYALVEGTHHSSENSD